MIADGAMQPFVVMALLILMVFANIKCNGRHYDR